MSATLLVDHNLLEGEQTLFLFKDTVQTLKTGVFLFGCTLLSDLIPTHKYEMRWLDDQHTSRATTQTKADAWKVKKAIQYLELAV